MGAQSQKREGNEGQDIDHEDSHFHGPKAGYGSQREKNETRGARNEIPGGSKPLGSSARYESVDGSCD
jgi:hypothetical protein